LNCRSVIDGHDRITVNSSPYAVVFVEGTLRWKNYALYSGVIEIGETPATVQAGSEYIYEVSGNQPALTSESSENNMIGAFWHG